MIITALKEIFLINALGVKFFAGMSVVTIIIMAIIMAWQKKENIK